MLHVEFTLSYLEIYLATLNIFAFVLYGYDKIKSLQNTKNISRVSEKKLLLFTFFGGTVGSLLSMFIFRHKIKKNSFLIKFFLVVISQIIIVFIYLRGFIYALT